ncbi:MAG TPA: alcohol dehydrogenase catalytic domain-containing protein [Ilumatobacter sp.]|nr:alcohol dehydrogenase catalytic domain-containing protein [Ilumatobacter sp.]
MRARAAVVGTAGAAPELVDIDVTEPGPGEVLVRVAATGVCHTDLNWQDGTFAAGFPVVLGHECAGVVAAVGPGVRRVAPGDHVVLAVTNHCGQCFHCERGDAVLCTTRYDIPPRLTLDGATLIQGFGIGGFSELTVVQESAAVPIPKAVPLGVAAVVGCAVATGLGAVLNVAEVRAGSTVAVFGCGGIGASVLLGAALAGAEQIVGIDPNPARRTAAATYGATVAVEPDEGVLRELAPSGYDYVFEASGHVEAMELAVRMTRWGGTTTLIGAPRPGARFSIDALELVITHRRVLGCNMGNLRPHVDFDAYFRLYTRGLLDLQALVTRTVPIDDIAGAFQIAAAGEGVRTVVTF